MGNIIRNKENSLYGKSHLGLLLYQLAKNHFEAQPIKIFEYMAAGVSFDCSNFPLWKEIVEDAKCGIAVDCTDVEQIHNAIMRLLSMPEEA